MSLTTNHCGYGVTIKGELHGVLGVPFHEAEKSRERYIQRGYQDVHIVPLYVGEPVRSYAPVVHPVSDADRA